jgi:hypothetical protein
MRLPMRSTAGTMGSGWPVLVVSVREIWWKIERMSESSPKGSRYKSRSFRKSKRCRRIETFVIDRVEVMIYLQKAQRGAEEGKKGEDLC